MKKLTELQKHNLKMLFIVTVIFLMNAGSVFMMKFTLINTHDLQDAYYNTKVIKNLEQNITKIVGDYCLTYDKDIRRIKCVNNYVYSSDKFIYNKTNNVILADELIENGGDCKSWATFYKAVFTYMGYDSNFVYSEKHVYVNVFNEDFYCNVDQQITDCYEVI
jgi:hypothetical protein